MTSIWLAARQEGFWKRLWLSVCEARKRLFSRLSPKDAFCLAVLLALAAISFWSNRTIAAGTRNDFDDYALPALNFFNGKGFVLLVDGRKYPPIHPFGLPLLISGVYLLLGADLRNGLYLIFACGVAVVGLTYWVGRRLFGARVGFTAGVFLLVAEYFRCMTKQLMSDVPSTFFWLASHCALLAAVINPQSPLWLWALIGQLLGFSVTLRPDNILILLPASVLVVLRIRSQQRALAKALLLGAGVALWVGSMFLANVLYTGDLFRSPFYVTQSAVCDRPKGPESLSYVLYPTFRESNLNELLRDAQYQWSLYDPNPSPAKRAFYYIADGLLVLGVLRLLKTARVRRSAGFFLLWAGLCVLGLMLFLSGSFAISTPRHMQRVVPYLSLLNAVGLITVCDALGKLRGAVRALLAWLRLTVHTRFWSCVGTLGVQLTPVAGMAILAGNMFLNPTIDPYSWMPLLSYVHHVDDVVREKNALVISNVDSFLMEEFIVDGGWRQFLPLHRFVVGADWYAQWKRPPHPEWIAEDYTNRAYSQRYKRMHENGAEEVFPQTAVENPEVIHAALRAGRPVYFVCPGIYTPQDQQSVQWLANKFKVQIIEQGYTPPGNVPEPTRAFARNFFIARLSELQLGTRLQVTSSGKVLIER